MKMTHQDATATNHLHALCEELRNFNTAVCDARRDEFLELAQQTPPEHFHEFTDFASSLLDAFAETPWKKAARNIMAELANHMSAAQKELTSSEDAPDPPEPQSNRHSVALATQKTFSSLDWIRLLDKAQPPMPLQNSIDALVNRNTLTETVFKTLFEVLHLIDAQQAFDWTCDHLEKHRGTLDQDIVRDLLRCWAEQPLPLPQNAMKWTLEWAGDEELRHQWPVITQIADRILRNHAMTAHRQQNADTRRTLLKKLHRLFDSEPPSDAALRTWADEAVERIGTHIQAFSQFDVKDPADWTSKALREELDAVNELLPPLLLLADLILAETNGATRLAMALIGMPEAELERWRSKLEHETARYINKTFLDDLREGRTPEKSIRAFCLGDTELLRRMISDLDILTREFESIKQREKATAQLAAHYASFRERHKLPKELTRRYRRIMQALHEDTLNRCLAPEDAEYVAALENLRELASAAADARRYLARYDAWNDTLQELLATRLDFEKSIRNRRLRLAHGARSPLR